VKTTGSKGLHVVVPLQRGPSWDEMADFAEALARNIVVEDAATYTASMSKAVRHARIFIDYLRNARGATSVAAYSTRARPAAPISTPLRWEELASDVRSDHYTVENVRQRLATLKTDPWADYWTTRQSLTLSRRKAVRDR
jgi:bifunctional non-homologous end joining protein LigD